MAEKKTCYKCHKEYITNHLTYTTCYKCSQEFWFKWNLLPKPILTDGIHYATVVHQELIDEYNKGDYLRVTIIPYPKQ